MIPHGLAALTLVSEFLAREVLPAVPLALTAELRAAIKLLETTREELDALYPTLRKECTELLSLCAEAHALLREQGASSSHLSALSLALIQGFPDLSSLTAAHRELLEVTDVTLCALERLAAEECTEQRDSHALFQRFYAALARHAETRLPWQVVFPR
jgi:hypothetical protein